MTTGNKYLDIIEEPIKRNIAPLFNKLNIFPEALKANNENDKEDKLYEKNKDLCQDLIEKFYDINENENSDRLNDLKKELKSFKDIYFKAKNILEEYKYNPIHFYGILFCYLHYYDKANFPKTIEEFSEGNSDILYEILIDYYSHLCIL